MNDHLTKFVTQNPHSTNFIVTLIGSLVCLVVDILFSFSVVRLAQEWLAVADEVTVFHVSMLSAFRYQSWPWGVKDLKIVFGRKRWLLVLLLGVCIGAFTFVPSGTTSLLSPIPFNETVALSGTELDFSSTAIDCIQFLDANPLSNNCDWQVSWLPPQHQRLAHDNFPEIQRCSIYELSGSEPVGRRPRIGSR